MWLICYHAGYKARLNDLSIKGNPYTSLSKLWHAWNEGWLTAHSDSI